MLTKLKVYTAVQSAPTLLLTDPGQIQADKLQITKITGLNPVKAAINTSQFASIDGVAFTGSNTPGRNIVLTIRPNPDWATWTIDSLRKLIYLYFLPKSSVQLVFEDDTNPPVTIFGYVESCEDDKFSNDVQFQVSILCPDPYFSSLNPIVITGTTENSYAVQDTITYNGDVPTGIKVEVDNVVGEAETATIQIQTVDPSISIFEVAALVNADQYFVMSSVAGNKYVDTVRITTGIVISLLSKFQAGSVWPILVPGDNPFAVVSDVGNHNWTLTYYERFGGL